MTPVVTFGILSIVVGFLFFGFGIACFCLKKPVALTIAMFAIAVVFLTFFPVGLAIFGAS